MVSLDGGYVHARSKESRKDGSFEVIVGKSTTGDGATTRFGLVSGYDTKPRRRLFEILRAQGLQMNQAITFLTDGGDTVRDLTEGHSPQACHILDWFHITMRLTVLNQMAKGVSVEQKGEQFEEELERVKWFLWHSPRVAQRVFTHQESGLRAFFLALLGPQGRGISHLVSRTSESIE